MIWIDHAHWGMNMTSTHLLWDYLETLIRSWLNEEASVARHFHHFGWRVLKMEQTYYLTPEKALV